MAESEAGSTPADCRRSAISRAPRPASMSSRVAPDSITVVLPELPDPRTRKRTRGCYPRHRPRRARRVADSNRGGRMLDALLLSLTLTLAPGPQAVAVEPPAAGRGPRTPVRMPEEDAKDFLDEVEEYVEVRNKARAELPKLKEDAEPE